MSPDNFIKEPTRYNPDAEFEELCQKEFPGMLDAIIAFSEFLQSANACGCRGVYKVEFKEKAKDCFIIVEA